MDRDAARERLAARLDGDPATTTVQAGTLTLTVWPDTPAGEHQRYAYRIIDTTTGRELEGRDLFTGAGQPVDPDHAIRDLAVPWRRRQGPPVRPRPSRQHARAHRVVPGMGGRGSPRTNADALTELTEPAEPAPASEASGTGRQWINVVFLQNEEADQVLDVIDRDGTAAALEHLAGYDYGDETTQAALENGYVYDKPPTGPLDRVITWRGRLHPHLQPVRRPRQPSPRTPHPARRRPRRLWCGAGAGGNRRDRRPPSRKRDRRRPCRRGGRPIRRGSSIPVWLR